MMPNTSSDKQRARGMNFGIGMLQEVGNHIGAMPLRMLGLEVEAGIFLVTLGGESDVVELDFVSTGLGRLLGQRDVVFLHLGLGRIGPDQLAVLTPRLSGLVRLHGEFGMGFHQPLVAENGDPSDGVHVLRMQKVDELGQVAEWRCGDFRAADDRREWSRFRRCP